MAGTNNVRDKAKMLWLRGMKTIGNTAANIANNTKYKVDEMTLQNRRRELAGDLSHVVYSLWLKGTEFPAEVAKMLEEMQELDDRLNDMRAEKYAQGKVKAIEPGTAEEPAKGPDEPGAAEETAEGFEEADAAEETAEGTDEAYAVSETEHKTEYEPEEEEKPSEAITGASPFLQSEINGYFDGGTSVDKAAEKVNTSLAQLTEKIRSFAPDLSGTQKEDDQGNSSSADEPAAPLPQIPPAKDLSKTQKAEDASEETE